MPRLSRSILISSLSCTPSLSHWVTTRPGMRAGSSGTSSTSGTELITMPPTCCERCRGKSMISAHSSNRKFQRVGSLGGHPPAPPAGGRPPPPRDEGGGRPPPRGPPRTPPGGRPPAGDRPCTPGEDWPPRPPNPGGCGLRDNDVGGHPPAPPAGVRPCTPGEDGRSPAFPSTGSSSRSPSVEWRSS